MRTRIIHVNNSREIAEYIAKSDCINPEVRIYHNIKDIKLPQMIDVQRILNRERRKADHYHAVSIRHHHDNQFKVRRFRK